MHAIQMNEQKRQMKWRSVVEEARAKGHLDERMLMKPIQCLSEWKLGLSVNEHAAVVSWASDRVHDQKNMRVRGTFDEKPQGYYSRHAWVEGEGEWRVVHGEDRGRISYLLESLRNNTKRRVDRQRCLLLEARYRVPKLLIRPY